MFSKLIGILVTAAQQLRCSGLKEAAGAEFETLAAAERNR
jgi:hypothetical protein